MDKELANNCCGELIREILNAHSHATGIKGYCEQISLWNHPIRFFIAFIWLLILIVIAIFFLSSKHFSDEFLFAVLGSSLINFIVWNSLRINKPAIPTFSHLSFFSRDSVNAYNCFNNKLIDSGYSLQRIKAVIPVFENMLALENSTTPNRNYFKQTLFAFLIASVAAIVTRLIDDKVLNDYVLVVASVSMLLLTTIIPIGLSSKLPSEKIQEIIILLTMYCAEHEQNDER